jgi:hypothetical protein
MCATAEAQEVAAAIPEQSGPVAVAVGAQEAIDATEAYMLAVVEQGFAVAVEMPVAHTRTPGLYVRTISMPAGTVLTSKIHRTEHPFVVHAGTAEVFIDGVGAQVISAPYVGVTKPGTRRVLRILEDCVWSTFHPCSDDETLEDIEARIIEPRLLPGGVDAHLEYGRQLAGQTELALKAPEEESWPG